MPNYRALVAGGYFSDDPHNIKLDPVTGKRVAVSIRMNNPGAVNGAAWETQIPGFVATEETTPGNKTTIFETPEAGVAAWFVLLAKYRAAGAVTLREIILRYGGTGQTAVYADYARAVSLRTGLALDREIVLAGDDVTLLKFAKGMFAQEAGRSTPLSDQQILYGFALGRALVPKILNNNRKVAAGTTLVLGGGAVAAHSAANHDASTVTILVVFAAFLLAAGAVYYLLKRFYVGRV